MDIPNMRKAPLRPSTLHRSEMCEVWSRAFSASMSQTPAYERAADAADYAVDRYLAKVEKIKSLTRENK